MNSSFSTFSWKHSVSFCNCHPNGYEMGLHCESGYFICSLPLWEKHYLISLVISTLTCLNYFEENYFIYIWLIIENMCFMLIGVLSLHVLHECCEVCLCRASVSISTGYFSHHHSQISKRNNLSEKKLVLTWSFSILYTYIVTLLKGGLWAVSFCRVQK